MAFRTTLNVKGAALDRDAEQSDEYGIAKAISKRFTGEEKSKINADSKDSKDSKDASNLSYDKVVQGYTAQGLPFLVVMQGRPDGQPKEASDFVDQYVVPCIASYPTELGSTSDEKSVRSLSKNKIEEILTLQRQHAPGTSFTLAVALVFKNLDGSQLQLTGWSGGSCGVVLDRDHSQYVRLPNDPNMQFNGEQKDISDSAVFYERNLQENNVILLHTALPPKFDWLFNLTAQSIELSNPEKWASFPMLAQFYSASLSGYFFGRHQGGDINCDFSIATISIPNAEKRAVIMRDVRFISELSERELPAVRYCCGLLSETTSKNSRSDRSREQFMIDLANNNPPMTVVRGALLMVLKDIFKYSSPKQIQTNPFHIIIREWMSELGISLVQGQQQQLVRDEREFAHYFESSPMRRDYAWMNRTLEQRGTIDLRQVLQNPEREEESSSARLLSSSVPMNQM